MIRFKNAKVLTMAGTPEPFDGEVWVDKDKISFVGTPDESKLKNTVFEKEYDAEGNLIMPSFKNAHTHSAMTFLRSYADDLPLQQWLFDKVFPMEDKLTGEHIYWLTKLAILEYLTSGVTACFDMYFYPEDFAKANIESGFRAVMCGSVSGGSENAEKLADYIERFNGKNKLISYRLGFHAEYTADYELMARIGELAKKYKLPVSVHNSETLKEVKECIEKYSMTPTELFDSLGIYDYGGAGFHCVHMTENDLDIFIKKNVYAVSCPASNAKLASGIAPICRMLEKGVKLALGTDGAASNNCLDMFREMFLLTALQKLAQNDAAACPAFEALKAATVGSANAMGLSECDTLEAGKQADLIVIDLSMPNMQPLNSIANNLVYSGSKSNVKLTMCAGKILYENGKFFIGADEKEIYAKANEIIGSMK